ncbi:MAG: hypothetical protein IJK50_05790 [Prevotella sp.]|nr:hypothetical protein [Prevotella sp.]
MAARKGNDDAKKKLKQFNYNDQLPDGVLRGSHTSASTFAHDIDSHSKDECQEIAKKLLDMKEQLQLLELTVSPNWGFMRSAYVRKARPSWRTKSGCHYSHAQKWTAMPTTSSA